MSKCVINNAGGANGVMIKILNFFVGKGYTPTQACAIAGNVYGESSFRPSIKNEIGCIGLFQWCSTGKRKEKLIAKYGDPGWKDINNQLDFVWGELSPGGERESVGEYFQNKDRTLTEYTYHWLRYFETPSTNETKLRNDFMPDRMKAANAAAAVYNQMNNGECVVGTSSLSGTESSGFSCSIDTTDGTTSDLNIVDDTSIVAETTTAQSNGVTETSKKNVDVRPLFIGDSWAYKIFHNDEYMKKNWGLLAKQGLSMSSVAKALKKTLSNKYRRPKYIVVYCGDDTKLKNNTSSMFVSGSVDLVKNWCREILSAGNGIQFYFCENVMNSIYRAGKSDYYWTAASVLNRALKKLEDEGDSARFRVIKIDSDTRIDLATHHSLAIPSELRMTLNPSGFTKLGSYIRKKIQG